MPIKWSSCLRPNDSFPQQFFLRHVVDVHAVERDVPVHGEFPVYVTIQPRSSCQATLTVLEPLVLEQWYHQLFETTYLHLKSYSAAVFAQPWSSNCHDRGWILHGRRMEGCFPSSWGTDEQFQSVFIEADKYGLYAL